MVDLLSRKFYFISTHKKLVVPLMKWMSNFYAEELCEFILAPILAMKQMPTPIQTKLSTSLTADPSQQNSMKPFSMEVANKIVAPLFRQINLIKDDGSFSFVIMCYYYYC